MSKNKNIAVPKKKKQEHVLRAMCYQYLRMYLSHLSPSKAWGDFFFLYQMNDTFYDQNRENEP